MSTNKDLTQTYEKPLTNVVATAAASKTSNKTSKEKPNFPTRGRKKVRSGQAENNLPTRGSYKPNYYSWKG
jgi:hypothetical protein